MMTADEIARIRAEALEEAARVAENLPGQRGLSPEHIGGMAAAAAIRALIASPPLVDQRRQERVEDRLDEPEHCGAVHDAGRGVGEQPAAIDTDEARGRVLDVDLGHGWSPIETAPKDGTRILVAIDEDMEVAHWELYRDDGEDHEGEEGDGYWSNAMQEAVWNGEQPEFWMPLPKPPQPAGG
jgi:hypothetical protein